MPHFELFSAAAWAAWAVEPEIGDDPERPSTPADLLQRGVRVAAVLPGGEVLVDVGALDPTGVGELVTPADGSVATAAARYRLLPASVKPRVYAADVLRCAQGGDLRGACCETVDALLPPYCPATGLRSSAPEYPVAAALVLAQAQLRAAVGEAMVLRVPMIDVLPGDVVVSDTHLPHAWAGERPGEPPTP